MLAGLGVFYYTPAFAVALHTHVGHELMNTTAVALGLIFATAALAAPATRRTPRSWRGWGTSRAGAGAPSSAWSRAR